MPAITGDPVAGVDFRTVLRNQSPPIVASAPGSLGTVTPSLPAANTAPVSISPVSISPVAISPVVIGGEQLFVSDPIGTGPARDAMGQAVSTHYNPTLFATDRQAAALAAQLGGVVYKAPLREAGGGTPASAFTMPDANYIKMPNGAIVNAGNMVQWAGNGRFDLIRNEIATPAATTGTGADYWYKQFPGPEMQNIIPNAVTTSTLARTLPGNPGGGISAPGTPPGAGAPLGLTSTAIPAEGPTSRLIGSRAD